MSTCSIRLALTALIVALLVSACGGSGSSASPPAGGLTLVPGDTQVTITWQPDSSVDYWLFYAADPTVTTINWPNLPGGHAVLHVTSPFVVTGLTNGTTYSFTMNGRVNNGPGGPGTPTVSATPRVAGLAWTLGGSLGATDMHGVAFGAIASAPLGIYVAVGNGGAMFQSADGAAWTAIPGVPATNLNAAVFDVGIAKFIAAGAAGEILYSTDAITWTAATSNTIQNLNSVATNGAALVAVGDNGTIRFSTDGVTWVAAATVPTANNLYGVTFVAGSGLWLAVGAGGVLLTSVDGSNWTAVTSNTAANLRSVAAQVLLPGGVATYIYVAVGDGGTILTSSDAITWTSQIVNPAINLMALAAANQVVLGSNLFVAVGTSGSAYTSPDGVVWTSEATGTAANLLGIIRAQGQYVAVGQSGTSIFSR